MKLLAIYINDIEIFSLLMNLRDILNEGSFSSEVHITIKGPQKTFQDHKSRKKFLESLQPIFINGIDMFQNNGKYIVYFKVKCDSIKGHMWKKPDYKDEYNPHITIFKGSDKKRAEIVRQFLINEEIHLTCKEYGVQIILPKQLHLFKREYLRSENGFQNLVKSGCVKKGILHRAKNLVASM